MTKTILITGSTDGIGLEAAKVLYSQGHHILLHGRSDKKLKAAEKALSELSGDGRIESHLADLSRMADVETLGEAIAAIVRNRLVFAANRPDILPKKVKKGTLSILSIPSQGRRKQLAQPRYGE